MTLYETLQKTSSEVDVKAAYIKALGLKNVQRNLIGNQTNFVADSTTNAYTHNALNQVETSQIISAFSAPPREICYDNNGNITKYIDESGNIVAAYEYDDFGRLISRSGSLADFFRIRFSTKYFDSENGLYCYGYRFYSPTLMRWLNRDPIGEEGGLNLYGFCVNSPVNMTDHFGLATVKESLVFMYDLTTGIVPGKILAYTDASAFLQVDCACDGQKSRRWVLNSVSLEIIATVHHQKNGYGANIGASFFAHKSESEHVNDIKYGVRDLIAPTINNQEMILKMNGYGSQLECVTANTEAILRLVSGMLKKTIQDSVDNRDKTGKHDWIGF